MPINQILLKNQKVAYQELIQPQYIQKTKYQFPIHITQIHKIIRPLYNANFQHTFTTFVNSL